MPLPIPAPSKQKAIQANKINVILSQAKVFKSTDTETFWKKAYISGASAKATASFKQYKKDVYLQTITRTVTISCNKSGKLY